VAETPEEAIAVMRQASEVVSSVLPSALAELVYDELVGNIDAVLHGSTPQLQWVAREVLTLAEQQQTRPAHTWRIGDDPGADRALMVDAAEYVINRQLGSTSAMQRNIRVGFAKAGQLMDLLETWGVVGPADGSTARKVLVSKEHLPELVAAIRRGSDV
jgi:DNA segregation ATPase FtsK/SpoIIIE-like protein